MINWKKISEKIYSNTRQILSAGTPSLGQEEIIESIQLFRKVLLSNSGAIKLNGLSKVLIPALQDAFIDKIGDVGSLRIIADSLEPFMKKLLIIGKGLTPSEVHDLTLIPALKRLEINTSLTNQIRKTDFPKLSEENLLTFRNESQYLYEICNSYVIRNKVHESPDFSDLDVLTYLRDLLVLFLYSVAQFKEQINDLPSLKIESEISDQVLNGDENKMLFDFISFGNTTTEIKTQIIDAFILHYLLDKQSVELTTLKEKTNKYINTELTDHFYKRKAEMLRQNGKLDFVDELKNSVKLSTEEQKRIEKVKLDFEDNKQIFLLYYKEIIDKHELNEYFDSILEKLTSFFVSNFNVDLVEIFENDSSNGADKILYEFINYIQSITNNEEKAKEIVIEFLKLSEDSDFIVRISASKVIGEITNPEYFQNYIRKQKRIVYVDTQLVLHALCTGYVRKTNYNNIYYLIIEELISYSKSHPNIELRFSRRYLSEVAYQLKLALLLIPFEEYTTEDLSANVFYLFYNHLKYNSLLKEDDESFGKFLENWLLVNEDDALNSECDQIISSNISSLLKDELQIKVASLPYYEIRDSAISVLEETIKKNLLTPKSYHILTNDALMVCHLSNAEEHETEPIFLTWDKAFTHFRKEFKNKFSRMDIISWHLFNPSKFLNHMSLINFKIDPKSITNEYLSIIDGMGLHERTRTIVDNMNRFLDIKNISKKQRRRYVQLTKSIFNEKEFSNEISLPEQEIKSKVLKPFESIIDDINLFFYDTKTKYSIDFYKKVLLKEDYFVKIVEIIKNEIISSINNDEREDYKKQIVCLLDEHSKIIKTQHNNINKKLP